MSLRAWVTGLCLLAGCGSRGGGPPDAGSDAGIPMPSMLSATGGLTGMISAPKPTAGHESTANTSFFNLKKTAGTGLAFKVDINIGFNGAPMQQTYTNASGGFTCNATITSGTTADDTWVALYDTPAGMNTGTCSLTLTSAATSPAGYDVAGNVTITATANGGGASGTVTVMGTF